MSISPILRSLPSLPKGRIFIFTSIFFPIARSNTIEYPCVRSCTYVSNLLQQDQHHNVNSEDFHMTLSRCAIVPAACPLPRRSGFSSQSRQQL